MGRCPSRPGGPAAPAVLLAERGQGSRRLGALPCLSLPHPALPLQLQFDSRCPKPGYRKLPRDSRPGVASAGPVADLPVASSAVVGPVAGVCPQVLLTGKPGLTLGQEDVLATPQGGPVQGWPFSREPLAGIWVSNRMTCGLTMDSGLRHGWSLGLVPGSSLRWLRKQSVGAG